MDKKTVLIDFCDFRRPFDKNDNFIINALRKHYKPIVTSDANFLFHSHFGLTHLKRPECVRIFTSIENVVPDFNIDDYAISSINLDFGHRHLYMPTCFSLYCGFDNNPHCSVFPVLPPLSEQMALRRFCNYIYSHGGEVIKHGPGASLRKRLCQALMAYRRVDCPGRSLHNMDDPDLQPTTPLEYWNSSKWTFISKYKFTIAFDSSSTRGYITEKLTDAFIGNSLPIYWGNEGSVAPFPANAVINAADFSSIDSLVEYIRKVDQDDNLYLSKLAANPLRNGMTFDRHDDFERFLCSIIERGTVPLDKDSWHFSDIYRLVSITEASGTLDVWLKAQFYRFAKHLCFGTLKQRIAKAEQINCYIHKNLKLMAEPSLKIDRPNTL